MTATASGPSRTLSAGQEYDIDDAEAKGLIEGGYAAPVRAAAETMTLAPVEATAILVAANSYAVEIKSAAEADAKRIRDEAESDAKRIRDDAEAHAIALGAKAAADIETKDGRVKKGAAA